MTGRTYVNKIRGVEEITDAEIQSALKRINDRLYQLNKKGLNTTAPFKKYQSLSMQFSGTLRFGKNGRISVDLGYLDNGKKRTVKNLTLEEKKVILEADRHGGTAGNELKKAREWLKENGHQQPTDEEIKNTAIMLNDIHEFIIENDNIIYDVERERGNIVTGNSGKLTEEQVNRLFNVKNERDAILEERKQNLLKKAGEESKTIFGTLPTGNPFDIKLR